MVVTNKELKARLREVSWTQSQVEDCSHYVVLCARRTATQRDVDRYLAQIEFTRHPSAEDVYKRQPGRGNLLKLKILK